MSYSHSLLASETNDAEQKLRYVYNFIAFTTWPNLHQIKQIQVCFLGQDSMGQHIQHLEGRRLHHRPLIARRILRLSDIQECQLVHVGSPFISRLPDVYAALGNSPVLVVTDSAKPTGAMINMYAESQGLMFEINALRAKNVGLEISSKLMQYARRPLLPQE